MKVTLTIFFIILCNDLRAQQFTISGYVRDSTSGENLIGANIYNSNNLNGTSTNEFGFYSLTQKANEVYLTISYVGYKQKKLRFHLEKDTMLNIQLSNIVLNELIITNTYNDDKFINQINSITIPMEGIDNTPALLGEVDIIKLIQLLPGVLSGNEGSSGLYIRGGGPDQNLILLDGVPIYNAAHLFGFFSIFNADAINNIEVMKGGFPARYGGRLSSVINITLKDGNKNEIKGKGSFGLISSQLTLEGPIAKNKTSFIVSGRRTYLDLLTKPFMPKNNEYGYYFYDLSAKINHQFSVNNVLSLSMYSGIDKAFDRRSSSYFDSLNNSSFNSKSNYILKWGNFLASLRWNKMLDQKLFSHARLNYTRYKLNILQEIIENTNTNNSTHSNTEYFSDYNTRIEDYSVNYNLEYLPNNKHNIKMGTSIVYHLFIPGLTSYKEVAFDTIIGSPPQNAYEYSLYIEDEFEIRKKLRMNLGVRFSGFQINKANYSFIQPRFNLNYIVSPSLSFTTSYAKMVQFNHLLSNSGLGLPTDLWVPSTSYVKPQVSDQLSIGIKTKLSKHFDLAIDAYHKIMENLIEYKNGASLIYINQNWENNIEIGNGEAYGIELFILGKYGRTNGTLGYTLSWNWRNFENLNSGNRFPYRYDRRHDLSLNLNHRLKEQVDLSFVFLFGSGNAISLPMSSFTGPEIEGILKAPEILNYESRNNFRLPAYHRLDLSINFKKEKKWGERTWHFGVYNLYNRQNPFFVDFDNFNREIIQYTLFTTIPFVRYSYKF